MLASIVSAAVITQAPVVLQAPAGREYARVVPGGVTILPNGRFLTPEGRRLYGLETVWHVALHPNQKTIALFHNGGFTVYDDIHAASATPRRIARKEIAPAGIFTRDGKRLIISEGDAGAIAVVNIATGENMQRISANWPEGRAGSYINDFVLSPDEKLLYGVDVAAQRLMTFDLQAGRVVSAVPAGRQPYAIAISKDGQRVFVANIGLFDYSTIPKPRQGEGNAAGLELPPFAFPSRESETGVDREGRFVPGIGKPGTPDAQSIWQYDVSGPGSPKVKRKVGAGLLIHAPADGGKAVGGSSPSALILRNGRLYVSNSNNDTIQAFDEKTMKLVRTIKLQPSPLVARLRGVIPSGMTMNHAANRLYVCESGLNSVAVVDPANGRTLYRIPSGWFPVSVRLASDDKTLIVASQKGIGRGPRGSLTPRLPGDERYGLPDMPGMAQVLTVPQDPATQRKWSQTVLANNGLVNRYSARLSASDNPIPLTPGKASEQIKYVVFITKENHTFDGIFGGLPGAKSEAQYAEFGLNGWIEEKGKTERLPIMPNHIKLATDFAISDNFYMEPQASGDGHRWLIGVYPSLWTTRVFYAGWDFIPSDTTKGRLVSMGSNGSQIPEDYLENGSMWEHLHRGGVTFRNYGEGYEFPGQAEPSENPPRSGSYLVVNHPLNKVLWENTCWDFPVYNNDIPDIARAEWFIEDIEKNYRAKKKPLPRFMNITLPNDHGARAKPNAGYPYVCSYMADNDLGLARVIAYLSRQPEWKNMAIFVTQDDPGGDDDHVDRHRSFVLAISPFAKRGFVSNDHTSIMSILKTIYLIFGLGPNNMFDALATDLRDMFTAKPDYRPYDLVNVDPRVFVPEKAYDSNDPSFRARRFQRPEIPMDDPDWIERLRQRGTGSAGGGPAR